MDALVLAVFLFAGLIGTAFALFTTKRVYAALPAFILLLCGLWLLGEGVSVAAGVNETTTWSYGNVSLPRFWEENQTSIVPLVNGTELVYAVGGSNSSWNENATIALALNESKTQAVNYVTYNNSWTQLLALVITLFACLTLIVSAYN